MTKTTWEDITIPEYQPCMENASAQVVIIGGGIAGTTTAYLLAKAGKKVIVVDKSILRYSITACTTAFLTRMLDTDTASLRKIFGSSKTTKILRSHEDAIDIVEHIIKEEKIECDFLRVPHYSVAFSTGGLKGFEAEHKEQSVLGFPTEMVPSKTFPFENKGGLLVPQQALFHPLKYVSALRAKAISLGAVFYENTEATNISGNSTVRIDLKNGKHLTADAVVTATYNPFKQPWWFIFKKGMYFSYVYELNIPKGAVPHGLYEDDNNPYCYFRSEKKDETHDRLIIGGEDHRKEIKIDPERNFTALREYVERTLGIKKYEIVTKWYADVLEQTDGIPLIGRYDKKHPNRYVETAFSGNGMTNGTIAALIVTDAILGNENTYASIYRTARPIPFMAIILKGRDYLGEFIHGVIPNLFKSKHPKEKKGR